MRISGESVRPSAAAFSGWSLISAAVAASLVLSSCGGTDIRRERAVALSGAVIATTAVGVAANRAAGGKENGSDPDSRLPIQCQPSAGDLLQPRKLCSVYDAE